MPASNTGGGEPLSLLASKPAGQAGHGLGKSLVELLRTRARRLADTAGTQSAGSQGRPDVSVQLGPVQQLISVGPVGLQS